VSRGAGFNLFGFEEEAELNRPLRNIAPIDVADEVEISATAENTISVSIAIRRALREVAFTLSIKLGRASSSRATSRGLFGFIGKLLLPPD
jgi:hypothetical protein